MHRDLVVVALLNVNSRFSRLSGPPCFGLPPLLFCCCRCCCCCFDVLLLGRTGTACYVPNRGCEMDVRRTKVQFDLGQVVFPFYE